MGFLTSVGALVVGLIAIAVLLTVVTVGWDLASAKWRWFYFLEPLLMPALICTTVLVGWIMHATGGGAGVLGVVVGTGGWVYVVYKYAQPKKPETELKRLLDRMHR